MTENEKARIFRHDDLDVLISPSALAHRITELGAEITRDYREGDLVLIGVLKGCFLFLADLA
ncbi:MAG: hypothetical protein FJ125_14105, partial [Deltaproteobacteria bacterium]|nr:hypothetical protein [Deltaproteobacteria bacterium]